MMVGNVYIKLYIVSTLMVEVATLSVNKMKIKDDKLNLYTKFYSVNANGCSSNA